VDDVNNSFANCTSIEQPCSAISAEITFRAYNSLLKTIVHRITFVKWMLGGHWTLLMIDILVAKTVNV